MRRNEGRKSREQGEKVVKEYMGRKKRGKARRVGERRGEGVHDEKE